MDLNWISFCCFLASLKSPQHRLQDMVQMTEFVLLSTASKTAWKISNRFKSYDHFSQYAN